MGELKIRHTFGVLLLSLFIAAIAIGLRLWSRSTYDSIRVYVSQGAASSPIGLPAPEQFQVNLTSKPNPKGGSQSNVLELPTANLDFVGDWGGYTRSTVDSGVPGALAAKGPDRVSITFGREGDTVFVGSELYAAPNQHIIKGPRAWMSDPSQALIEYEARDPQLDYVYLHRFKLLRSGKIAYAVKVDMYERRTHSWAGVATQHALLGRLTTSEEKRKFARPSPFEVSKGEVSAARSFAVPGSR